MNKETPIDRSELADKRMVEGYSCSQATLDVFATELGLERNTAFKMAGAFGGGMSWGEACGGVTGALMAIGFKYSPSNPEDKEAKQKTGQIAKEFIKKFEKRHGTITCRDLINYDFSQDHPEQSKEFYQELFKNCKGYVKSAVEIVEELFESGN